MGLNVQAFGAVKNGNSPEEYEDAYSYSLVRRRFAISDGATESSYADRWAQSLVYHFSKSPPTLADRTCENLIAWMDPLQKRWRAGIRWDNLPWYAEEKARQGAFATLLALQFPPRPDPSGKPAHPPLPHPIFSRVRSLFQREGPPPDWRALAIGDSCLFQIRGDTVLTAFPIDNPEGFNDRPVLLGSNPAANRAIDRFVHVRSGQCEENDLFILATDAMAQWLLRLHRAGENPWALLESIRDRHQFQDWIVDGRKSGLLKNDDTTVLFFRWKPAPEPSPPTATPRPATPAPEPGHGPGRQGPAR